MPDVILSPAELAARAARAAADALDTLSHRLTDVGTPTAMHHSAEAAGAAELAREWAAELDPVKPY